MCLRDLIERLERADPNRKVPKGFHEPHSYRGIYEDLAFEPTENITVGEMLAAAKSALGKTFEGYKGGDYEMDWHTDVWIAYEGSGNGEMIGNMLLDYMLGEVKE
jgi:hypothetical protein